MSVSVGIDIGTSNSCACFFRNGTYEIFTTDTGSKLLPSYVSYENGKSVCGVGAIHRVSRNDCFTVCSFKRVLGRQFDTEEVRAMTDRCIAPLRESASGDVEFYNQNNGETHTSTDLTTELIKDILSTVVKNSGLKIGDVTFTVPAYFTPQQRKVMEQAITNA